MVMRGEAEIDGARAFQDVCEALHTRAISINQRLNVYDSEPVLSRLACFEALATARAAAYLQRRLEATPADRRLDPAGLQAQALWELQQTLIAEQRLGRELHKEERAKVHGGAARQAQWRRLSRVLEARERLYRALEGLRMQLLEHELDARQGGEDGSINLDEARKAMKRLGW
ncbi:MAG: hypothetical protein LLP51_06775 [Halorhodospira halophila]|uniref:hypothetical protein n=1 Tax=Halorhodospira halophila TaxID=1053 RepID=UPI0026F25031|nr:hypothetical protein [Halorhodospira halophila]MCC3751082.1 hypothetical protein [Halorhodospira halophila]